MRNDGDPRVALVAQPENGRSQARARVWEEILMPKGCAGAYCHGSGVGGLKFMKKEEAYGVLVGVMAAGPSCGSLGAVTGACVRPEVSR